MVTLKSQQNLKKNLKNQSVPKHYACPKKNQQLIKHINDLKKVEIGTQQWLEVKGPTHRQYLYKIPIFLATQNNNLAFVKFFLDNGGDPNTYNIEINIDEECISSTMPLLHHFIKNKINEISQLLINKGAQIEYSHVNVVEIENQKFKTPFTKNCHPTYSNNIFKSWNPSGKKTNEQETKVKEFIEEVIKNKEKFSLQKKWPLYPISCLETNKKWFDFIKDKETITKNDLTPTIRSIIRNEQTNKSLEDISNFINVIIYQRARQIFTFLLCVKAKKLTEKLSIGKIIVNTRGLSLIDRVHSLSQFLESEKIKIENLDYSLKIQKKFIKLFKSSF